MSKTIKLCLLASLLLNLFLVGITFGYTGKSLWGCKPLPAHHMRLGDITGVLSPQKQQAIQPALAPVEQSIKQLRDQMYAERAKAATLIQANPFDKDAYMAEVTAIEKLQTQISDNFASVIVQVAQQGSDDEKAALAGMLQERIRQSAANQ